VKTVVVSNVKVFDSEFDEDAGVSFEFASAWDSGRW